MSTFNGLVKEFPNIRIDYFRNHPEKPPPAALFLSHVHSDHLLGLESVKMPFVYCSATTKRILLKMEKYPHRINFAKGILEARKQHYRHLKKVLRALPMNTATQLELGPKSKIRVTLLDANHCPGAVMFLIEGDGKAAIYTGDVRAEPWWVNSIVQTPMLIPYACGLKQLDCIYLDTTFATHDVPYRDFPTKAEGLKELLEKVSQYPPETVFYFRAWTLGYEHVWTALSSFLSSRIHVNQYQLQLFRGGDEDGDNNENAALTGFTVGNSQHPGCLTLDESARIHSCEPGLACHGAIKKNKNIIWISPIISRLKDGSEIRELGAGGGWRDLYPSTELKLEDSVMLQQVLDLSTYTDSEKVLLSKFVQELARSTGRGVMSMVLEEPDQIKTEDDGSIKLGSLIPLLAERFRKGSTTEQNEKTKQQPRPQASVNDTIHFPYSRHSSYNELRHLVSMFRPKDICPCTVSPEGWSEHLSMQALFGDLCSDQTFHFDQETRELVADFEELKGISNKRKRQDEDTQDTESQSTHYNDCSSPIVGTELASSMVFKDGGASESADNYQSAEELHLVADASESQLDHYLFLDAEDSEKNDTKSRHGHEEVLRKKARIQAYMAARLAVFGNDTSEWDAVSLRTVGRLGNDREELEL